MRFGVPNDLNNGFLEQRIPRIIAGIEVGKTVTEKNKISMLHYISLAPLRRAKSPINWITAVEGEMVGSFTDEAVLRAGSFDSLPMMIAIRIIRKFIEEGKGWDFPRLNRKIDLWVRFVSKDIEAVLGDKRSVMDVAVSETHGANIQETAVHIKNQVYGLVLQASSGRSRGFQLRGEAEIWELYRKHVIEKELKDDQKLALAKLALTDPDHELWKLFPDASHADTQVVVRWIYYNQPLPKQIARLLQEKITNCIDIRAETIRDIHPGVNVEELLGERENEMEE